MTYSRKWSFTVVHHDSQQTSTPLAIEAPDWTVALQRGRAVLGETAPIGQGADCTLAPDGSVVFTDSSAGKTYRLAPIVDSETSVPPTTSNRPPALALIHKRDHEPDATNPLSYRERSYFANEPTATNEASPQALLEQELDKIKRELLNAPHGKLVRLAAFDHHWSGRPSRPPVAVLEWKDWDQPAPQVASSSPPAVFSRPATHTATAAETHVSAPPNAIRAPQQSTQQTTQQTTQESADRLAVVFEALHELFYHPNVIEGAKVVLKILDQVLPCESMLVGLYDIDRNELQCVAALGTGAAEREQTTIAVQRGILGHSATSLQAIYLTQKPSEDPRFDPEVDLPPGVHAAHMALVPLVREGYMYGVIQLINPTQRPNGFSEEDVNVAVYTASQLAKFLQLRRLDASASPSK